MCHVYNAKNILKNQEYLHTQIYIKILITLMAVYEIINRILYTLCVCEF